MEKEWLDGYKVCKREGNRLVSCFIGQGRWPKRQAWKIYGGNCGRLAWDKHGERYDMSGEFSARFATRTLRCYQRGRNERKGR